MVTDFLREPVAFASDPSCAVAGAVDLGGNELIALSDLPDVPNLDGNHGGVEILDLDGDGFSDIVSSSLDICGNSHSRAWLFDPTTDSFVEHPEWALPLFVAMPLRYAGGIQFVDLNGDGLVDVYAANDAFVSVEPAEIPFYYQNPSLWPDSCKDANGNFSFDMGVNDGVFLNTGSGWHDASMMYTAEGSLAGAQVATLIPLLPGSSHERIPTTDAEGLPTGWRFVDVNGDGIQDAIYDASEVFCQVPQSDCAEPAHYYDEQHVMVGTARGTFVRVDGAVLATQPLLFGSLQGAGQAVRGLSTWTATASSICCGGTRRRAPR